MTTREEALKRLKEDTSPWPAGEPYTVRFYQPQDGYGMARLVYAVYGDSYPIDTFYIPEQLTAENEAGRIRSVVACTDSGNVICHLAIHRGLFPNPELYEITLGLTHPAYRSCGVYERCSSLLLSLLGDDSITAVFTEIVCNHTITQKMAAQHHFTETALEIDLMPARAYEKEHSSDGRVSCLMNFIITKDRRRPLFIPDCYASEIRFMMEGIPIERDIIGSENRAISGDSELRTELFSTAGVARCSIMKPGDELANRLEVLENELSSQEYALMQCFVPLGRADAAFSIDILRKAGFFLGGFLPTWFGCDGLLMQKLFVEPGFDSIKLHSERAKSLMTMVHSDWKRSKEDN